MSNNNLAKNILDLCGGASNIQNLQNCMTRVRITLNNDSLIKVEEIKKTDGVLGVIKSGDQYQIIVGAGIANKTKNQIKELIQNSNPNSNPNSSPPPYSTTDIKLKMKKKFSLGNTANDFLKNISNIFIPLISGMIGCGLLLGIANILKNPAITGNLYSNYPNFIDLISIFGSSVFVVMMVIVGITTARVYGGSIVIGAIMAGILTHPALANIHLFGEQLSPARGGIIAIILVVAFSSYLEKQLKKVLSGTFDLILNPILVIFISGIVAIVILQPIGGFLSDYIAKLTTQAINSGGVITGFILAGIFLPLVMTGLHQGLTPIHLQLITDTGMTQLLTILAMAGAGQVGASIAVLIKTKNDRIKKVVRSALPVGFLGIGEPLIYGVTLPLGKPFLTACIGGAFGGAVVALFKIGSVSIGISGITLLVAIAENKYLQYLLALLVAYIAGFIITYLVGFNDPAE